MTFNKRIAIYVDTGQKLDYIVFQYHIINLLGLRMSIFLSINNLPQNFIKRRNVLTMSRTNVGQSSIQFILFANLYGLRVENAIYFKRNNQIVDQIFLPLL